MEETKNLIKPEENRGRPNSDTPGSSASEQCQDSEKTDSADDQERGEEINREKIEECRGKKDSKPHRETRGEGKINPSDDQERAKETSEEETRREKDSKNSNQEDTKFDLLSRSKVKVSHHIKDLKLPLSFRFSPDDYELAIHYLSNKLLKRPLPVNGVIKTIDDLYYCDPNELQIKEFENCPESEVYYFMESRDEHRQYAIATANGIWLKLFNGQEQAICVENTIIGFRRDRVFLWDLMPPKKFSRTKWTVHELRLNVEIIPEQLLSDDVRREVCRLVACRVIKSTF